MPTTRKKQPPPGPLTVAEAARAMSVSPETVLRWIRGGHLAASATAPGRAVDDGHRGRKGYRIERAAVEAFGVATVRRRRGG